MVISIRLKNFFSMRDDAVLDFTADATSKKKQSYLPENLIEFNGDKFVNIIGLFGSNAAGKSNIIKAIAFCRHLILTSHLNNEGDRFDFEPFKFDPDKPSYFYINFVTEGIEYEYSFSLQDDKILSEELYYYPRKRRARVFSREDTFNYSHRKGSIQRPSEVEANTSPKTLFISRASSMNRPLAQTVFRFFLNEMTVGTGTFDISSISKADFEAHKSLLLKAFEVSDSDIEDIRMADDKSGSVALFSYHKENPHIAFDFEREESEGTKRLLAILLLFIKLSLRNTTVFLDEFDLKLHLRLAEFILDVVRASKSSQLVFTSHNSNLINRAKLRAEQIVFVNKSRSGNSEFVPLSDYEGVSDKTDIQKAYLNGMFDAVPYIGDVSSVLTKLLDRE